MEESPIVELQKILGVPISSSSPHVNFVDEADDKELLELSSRLSGGALPIRNQDAAIESLRHHWKNSSASSMLLRELGPLLRDYQRLIVNHYIGNFASESSALSTRTPLDEGIHHQFFRLKSASQLRLGDVPRLLSEYKELIEN